MKKMFLFILFILALASCNSQIPLNVAGVWSGSMTASGAVPLELILTDSDGVISGSMRYYDSTYGWISFGPVNGSHDQNGNATFTAFASDGSGSILFSGIFTATSFSGNADFYDSGTYVMTATVSLAKQ